MCRSYKYSKISEENVGESLKCLKLTVHDFWDNEEIGSEHLKDREKNLTGNEVKAEIEQHFFF